MDVRYRAATSLDAGVLGTQSVARKRSHPPCPSPSSRSHQMQPC